MHDEASSIKPVAYAGYKEDYLDHLHLSWADTSWGQSPAGIAIRTGQPAITQNILTDPRFAQCHTEALQHGYASVIGLPIMIHDKPVGACSLYASEPDVFTETEVQLLTKIIGDLALGITTLRDRRERDIAEQSLQKSEENYRTIVETVQEGMVIIDALEHVQYLNHQLAEMLGYPIEDILGQSFMNFVHPDDREVAAATFFALRQGKKDKFDIRLQRRDGTQLWALVSVTPKLDGTGTFAGILGMLIDITNEKPWKMK